MRYGSVCSGIEAATVAWQPLGWEPAFFSEIDPFACALLQQRHSAVSNFGDMTQFHEWPDAALDVLIAGTPCQSFSIAGLREGLADPRGSLALTYLAIVARYRPRWVLWENVPGVLSADGGTALGSFLAALAQLGYGWAYRSLDAQYFGLAQRRRRVFVVGHSGGWGAAAAVLFERQSLRGDPAPRRQAGQTIAASLTAGAPSNSRPAGRRQEDDVNVVLANPLGAHHGRLDLDNDTLLARCVTTREGCRQDSETQTLITHALRADGFDASEDGTGRGTPLVSIAFTQNQREEVRALNLASALSCIRCGDAKNETLLAQPYTLAVRGRNDSHDLEYRRDGTANALLTPNGGRNGIGIGAIATSSVRRLTPRECERLQGFADDYTLVMFQGKPAKDGRRYKALGNSMAVPVIRWLGRRIALVESLLTQVMPLA